MIRTTVQVSGMVCGMCEAHVNDAVRSAFSVKKVTSSRSAGETVILSENSLDIEKLRQVINAIGYIMLSADEKEWKIRRKTGLSVFEGECFGHQNGNGSSGG